MNQIYFSGFIHEGNQDLSKYFQKSDDSTYDDILPIHIQSNFTVRKLKWEDFCGEVEPDSCFLAHTFWNIQYTYELLDQKIPPKINQTKLSESPVCYIDRQSAALQKNERTDKINLKLPPVPPSLNRVDPPLIRQNSINKIYNASPNNSQWRRPSPNNNYFAQPSPRSNFADGRQNPRLQSRARLSRPQSQQNKDYIIINPDIKIQVSIKCYLTKRSWVKDKSILLLEHERGHYLLGSLCALEFKKQAECQVWEESEKTETLKSQVTILFGKILNQFLEIEKQYDIQTSHYLNTEIQNQWNRKIKEQLKLYEYYYTQ